MPSPKATAAASLKLALASVLLGSMDAAGVTISASVDTCPNANWQTLPVVKVRTPYATISALAASPTTEKAIDYVKGTVVPKAGANAVFLVLAVVFLLAFILWRAFRYCCFMCCCKSSCDAKRAERDPQELLFGKRMLVLKVFMYVLGIIAICFAIYGMASTDKALVKKAWTVVDGVSDYTLNLTGTLDHLLETIGNASLIIDDFQAIVTVTMNITGMQANLAAASAFLAAIPNPTTMKTELGTARADSSALNSALATLSSVVVAMDGTHLPAITSKLSLLNSAASSLSGFQALVDDLNTKIGALPNSDPTASDTRYTDFSAAVDAAAPGITSTWVPSIDSWLSAIDSLKAYQGSGNKFTDLSVTVTDMSSKTAAVGVSVPALSSSLNTLMVQNATGFPVLTSLLAQLATVNTSVLALDANMQSAYDLLSSTLTQLASVGGLSPAPAALTAQLTAAAGALVVPASTNALISASNNAASKLEALTALDTAKANLDSLRSALSAAPFTNAFNTMKTNRDNYATAPAVPGEYDTMYNQATNTFKPQLPAISTSMSNTASQIAGMPLGTTLTAANAVTNTMLITDQNTYAVAGQAVLTNLLPNLAAGGAYETALTAMGSAYDALGSPVTKVFDAPKAVLDSVYAAAITTGNSVKLQIADTVSSFSGSTGSIKTTITGNINKYQNDYEPMSQKFDGYRYTASMALYGLSILFILILFASYSVNYHFGTTFASFFLLVICVLYLLLAFTSAIVLIALGDVCPNIEPIVVDKVPSNMLPVARYYFYNEGSSLKDVLNSTGLVDIDAIMSQIETSKGSVVSSIAGNYTLREAPLAVLSRINTTFDGATTDVNALLAAASYEPVHAVYASIKSLLCCTFPDEFGHMWQGLTFAGVLALAMLLCTFFYIGKIDAAPRQDCCGCTFHTRARYAGTLNAPIYALPLHYGPSGLGDYTQPPRMQDMGSDGASGHAMAHIVINGEGLKGGKA